MWLEKDGEKIEIRNEDTARGFMTSGWTPCESPSDADAKTESKQNKTAKRSKSAN